MRLALLLTLTVCFSIAHPGYPSEVLSELRTLGVLTGEVPRVAWGHRPFADDVAEMEEPMVLTGTAVSSWRILQEWNHDAIASKAPLLEGVSQSSDRVFSYYHNGYPLEGAVDSSRERARSSTTSNVSTLEFFTEIHLSSQEDRPFYWYYGSLLANTPALEDDVDVSPLLTSSSVDGEERTRVQLWIGGAGVGTHLHYDEPDNFYAQVVGQKTFVLFPPSSLRALYPYPFLHPCHQAAQVNLSDVALDRFPLFTSARGIEVTLSPGEVLYIPPLWSHYVVSRSFSIAINAWCSNPTSEDIRLTRGLPIPISGGLPPALRALHHRLHLSYLLDGIAGMPDGAKGFARSVLDSRYRPIYGPSGIPANSKGRSYCVAALSDMEEDVYDEVWEDWEEDDEWMPVSAEEVLSEREHAWLEHLRACVPPYHEAARSDAHSMAVFAGDLVEMMALTIVDEAADVASFLHELSMGC